MKIPFIQKNSALFAVPFFRSLKFYGKSVIEGVQHPSETIYMPHYVNHAVYNLDQTVAVSDNPFYSSAIEESAFQLFRDGQNGYSDIKDSHIHVLKGLCKYWSYINQYFVTKSNIFSYYTSKYDGRDTF